MLESVKQHLDQTSTKRATQRSRFADKATPSLRKEREPSSSERVVSLSAYLAALFAALLLHPLFLVPPNPSFPLVLSLSLSHVPISLSSHVHRICPSVCSLAQNEDPSYVASEAIAIEITIDDHRVCLQIIAPSFTSRS